MASYLDLVTADDAAISTEAAAKAAALAADAAYAKATSDRAAADSTLAGALQAGGARVDLRNAVPVELSSPDGVQIVRKPLGLLTDTVPGTEPTPPAPEPGPAPADPQPAPVA